MCGGTKTITKYYYQAYGIGPQRINTEGKINFIALSLILYPCYFMENEIHQDTL